MAEPVAQLLLIPDAVHRSRPYRSIMRFFAIFSAVALTLFSVRPCFAASTNATGTQQLPSLSELVESMRSQIDGLKHLKLSWKISGTVSSKSELKISDNYQYIKVTFENGRTNTLAYDGSHYQYLRFGEKLLLSKNGASFDGAFRGTWVSCPVTMPFSFTDYLEQNPKGIAGLERMESWEKLPACIRSSWWAEYKGKRCLALDMLLPRQHRIVYCDPNHGFYPIHSEIYPLIPDNTYAVTDIADFCYFGDKQIPIPKEINVKHFGSDGKETNSSYTVVLENCEAFAVTEKEAFAIPFESAKTIFNVDANIYLKANDKFESSVGGTPSK